MTTPEIRAARQVANAYRVAGTHTALVVADAFDEYADALGTLEAEAREAFEAEAATRNSHWTPHGPPVRRPIQPFATEGPDAS